MLVNTFTSRPMTVRISDSTVRRLSLYLRMLRDLREQGVKLVSSRELAHRARATSAQVRKDLSVFGSFGKRGRGYEVEALTGTLEGILGLSGVWRVALVGVGKIGTALLGYRDLARRGFEVVAAFDVAEDKVGREVSGITVSDFEDLESIIEERAIDIAIVATPREVAASVAERLAEAGVRAILNFAPTELQEIDRVPVRTVDVVLELEGLSYLLHRPLREGAI